MAPKSDKSIKAPATKLKRRRKSIRCRDHTDDRAPARFLAGALDREDEREEDATTFQFTFHQCRIRSWAHCLVWVDGHS